MDSEGYEDIRGLGRGAYAVVRLVRRKHDNRYLVAKRFLQPLSSLLPKERLEVAQEIKLLSHLHHTNIIQFVDAFVDREGYQVLIMEYAPYGTLHSFLMHRNGEYLPEERIWELFIQITLALHYIHGCNILHRDIKSQNILLAEPDGRMVKLGDFGIAQILQHSSSGNSLPSSSSSSSVSPREPSSSQLEASSTIVGTPHYLSPEICQGQNYGHKSDIWSLGCVLYELICLHRPFDASNVPAIIFQVIRNQPKPLPSGIYSTELHDLVFSLLRSVPEERPNIHDIFALPKVQEHIRLWNQTLKQYYTSRSKSTTTVRSTILTSPSSVPLGVSPSKPLLPTPLSSTNMSKGESSAQGERRFNNRKSNIHSDAKTKPLLGLPLPSNKSVPSTTSVPYPPLLSVLSSGNQSRWTGPVSVVSSSSSLSNVSSPSSMVSQVNTPSYYPTTKRLPLTTTVVTDPEAHYLQLIKDVFLDPVNIASTVVSSVTGKDTNSYLLWGPPSSSLSSASSVSDNESTLSTRSIRSILRDRLLTIENIFLTASPAPSGRVWEALGASWAELGNFGNAVRCYRYALRAKSIYAPLDAVEQLGNLFVRYGHQLYRKSMYSLQEIPPTKSQTAIQRIENLAKEALMGISLSLLGNCPPMKVIPAEDYCPLPSVESSSSVVFSSPTVDGAKGTISIPTFRSPQLPSLFHPSSFTSLPPVWKILIQALVEEGIAYLERACALGNTAERRALLGSAFRQRAWMGLTPYQASLPPITTILLPDYAPKAIDRKIILENGQTIVSKLPSLPSITGDLKRAAQAYAIAHELEVEECITKYSLNSAKPPQRSSGDRRSPNAYDTRSQPFVSTNRPESLTDETEDIEGNNFTVDQTIMLSPSYGNREKDLVYNPYEPSKELSIPRNSSSSNIDASPLPSPYHHLHRHKSSDESNHTDGSGGGGGTLSEGKGWKSIFHQPPYARLHQLSLEILASGTDADFRHPSTYIDACREAETWALEATEADPTDMWRWLLVVDARRLRYMVGDNAVTEASIVLAYHEQFAFGVSNRMKSSVFNELQFELDVIHFRHQEALVIQKHTETRNQQRTSGNSSEVAGDTSPEELNTVLTNNELAIKNHLQGLIVWFIRMENHLQSLLSRLRVHADDILMLPDQDMDHIYKEHFTTSQDTKKGKKEEDTTIQVKEIQQTPVFFSSELEPISEEEHGIVHTEQKPSIHPPLMDSSVITVPGTDASGGSPRMTVPNLTTVTQNTSMNTNTPDRSGTVVRTPNPFARSTPSKSKFVPNRSQRNSMTASISPSESISERLSTVGDTKKDEKEGLGNRKPSESERPRIATISSDAIDFSSLIVSSHEYRSVTTPIISSNSVTIEPKPIVPPPLPSITDPSSTVPSNVTESSIFPVNLLSDNVVNNNYRNVPSVPSIISHPSSPENVLSPSLSLVPYQKCFHCRIM